MGKYLTTAQPLTLTQTITVMWIHHMMLPNGELIDVSLEMSCVVLIKHSTSLMHYCMLFRCLFRYFIVNSSFRW